MPFPCLEEISWRLASKDYQDLKILNLCPEHKVIQWHVDESPWFDYNVHCVIYNMHTTWEIFLSDVLMWKTRNIRDGRESNWFYKNNPHHQTGDAETGLSIKTHLARKNVSRITESQNNCSWKWPLEIW